MITHKKASMLRLAGTTFVTVVEILGCAGLLKTMVNAVHYFWVPAVPVMPFWVAVLLMTLKAGIGAISKTAQRLVSELHEILPGDRWRP